jgi:hypothetical protein
LVLIIPMIVPVIFTVSLVHLIVMIICLSDLLSKSKRSNKLSWAIFIVLFPAVGALVYDATKKRKRTTKWV